MPFQLLNIFCVQNLQGGLPKMIINASFPWASSTSGNLPRLLYCCRLSNYRRLQLACIGFHHEPGGVHLYHYNCICHGLLNRQEITRESEQKFGETGQSCVTPVPSKPRLLAGGAMRFSAMSEIRNVPPHGQDSVRKRLAHNIFKER